jgi:hypothetical protein
VENLFYTLGSIAAAIIIGKTIALGYIALEYRNHQDCTDCEEVRLLNEIREAQKREGTK